MQVFNENFVIQNIFSSDASVVIASVVQGKNFKLLKFKSAYIIATIYIDSVKSGNKVF